MKKGRKRTPETRAKISAALKGHKVSDATRAKISASQSGRKLGPEHIAKVAAWHRGKKLTAATCAKIGALLKGRKHSAEHRAKLSTAQKGKKHTDETRAKMSASRMGYKNSLGYKHSAETRAKMSASRRGPRNAQWRGGISKEPYSWDFTPELKEEVRRRDNYKCQVCGAPQMENIRALDIHHIDYDRKNSDEINLVALCRRCHMRTNTNRAYWTSLLQEQRVRADKEKP